MATFEEHIEGLTQIDITTSSAPTINELSQFLVEGLIDVVNKMIVHRPDEISRFTETTNSTSNVTKQGKVLSVMREHDSTSILRPCTPISPQLRHEATDETSMHYHSKYNPGFYEMNNTVFCVPVPNDASDNDLVVTQVKYDTGLVATDNYNVGNVLYFPIDYEYLIAIYGGAKAWHAAASDIQNNMPTKPTAPIIPIFSHPDFDLPSVPIMSSPQIMINFGKVESLLNKKDLDAVEKEFTRIDKQMEVFQKKLDIDNLHNTNNTEVFKAEVDKKIKDADRELQVQVGEYREQVSKYEKDINFYGAEVSEKVTKYKWFMEQYINLMNQYNAGIMPAAKPRQKPRESAPRQQRGEQ